MGRLALGLPTYGWDWAHVVDSEVLESRVVTGGMCSSGWVGWLGTMRVAVCNGGAKGAGNTQVPGTSRLQYSMLAVGGR